MRQTGTVTRVLGYAIVTAVAAVVTLLLVPWSIRIATPQIGGLAMCCGLVAALLAARLIPQFREMYATREPLGVIVGALIITGIGIIDDRRDMSPPAKLAGIVLAGSAMYFLGVTLDFFRFPFVGVIVLSPDWVPLVTVFWVVGMANAINFIDGLDGLAAGITAIAAATYFLYATRLFDAGLIQGDNIGPLVAAATLGICIGFLRWNFSPAKLFMGDSGALLLGLLVAASTMVVGGRAGDTGDGRQTFFFLAPLLTPFVILGVPILDTLLAITRRTMKGSSFALADRRHLHHRLLELGHGPRRVVVILWSCSALLSGFVLAPLFVDSVWIYLPIGFGVVATAMVALRPPDRHRPGR
jgi:UDP-GlcNAc:undecaprenyl-phosphate/decaprenyl-phosphate GlcNAc-1-phosphate transferase